MEEDIKNLDYVTRLLECVIPGMYSVLSPIYCKYIYDQ